MVIDKIDTYHNIFFTSDTHYNHENIIKFCDRPFKSIEEMNDKLIENWNSVVEKNDIVFHLGDVAFGSPVVWDEFISQLNGQIYLIIGNHDIKNLRPSIMNRFKEVTYQKYIKIGNTFMYLNHCPLLCYGGMYKNTIQLFGHVHTSKYKNSGKDFNRLDMLAPCQYDVGVDLNDFTPISFGEVCNKIKFQEDNNTNVKCWIP